MADDTRQPEDRPEEEVPHNEPERRTSERRTSARRRTLPLPTTERPTDPTQLHPFDPEYERETSKPKHGVMALLNRTRAMGRSQEIWMSEEELPKYRMPESKPRAPGERPDESDPLERNLKNATQMLGMDNFLVAIRTRCVRNSFMTGIGVGFAMTFMRLILRRPKGAVNWGVFTGAGTSALVFPYCIYGTHREKAQMQKAMEISQQRKIAAEKKREEERAARRKAREEEQQRRAEEERRKASWWKLW